MLTGTLQRLNVVTSFTMSVVLALIGIVTLLSLQRPLPSGEIKVQGLDVYVNADQRLWPRAVARRPPHAGVRGGTHGRAR